MNEFEAKAWLSDTLDVSRETLAQLEQLRELVVAESARQNLVSAATIPHFWARHIVDSAQLLPLAKDSQPGAWLDLGTGAGFPGMVIAILSNRPIILAESRRKRFEFLREMAVTLKLPHVSVHGGRLETLATRSVSVISARAFAPLPKLLDLAIRFSRNETVWLLPKGQSAQDELVLIDQTWHGKFHVNRSITDQNAAILVGEGVSRRK
ncbi:MAG: 16S rRNA (guanine(527)-N(7))-methyltransferase RsmG [Pseudomonadota bacterium]